MNAQLMEGIFSLPSDDVTLKGYFNHLEDWNGWKIPYFTKEVAESFAADTNHAGQYTAQWDGDKLTVTHTEDKDDQITCEPINHPEYGLLYCIGGYHWCWSLCPMNLEESKEFLKAEIEYLGSGFHPDTRYEDYINSKGEYSYPPEKAAELNIKMEQAFDAFYEAGEDIYEFCMNQL